MHTGRTLIRTLLAVVAALLATASACASAQSPFVIHGLHSELTLDEALAQAEKLGGDCQVIANHPSDEGRNIQCVFTHCDDATTEGDCNTEDPTAIALSFADQPILSILLQAPADAAPLKRIIIVYSGATEAVATGLIEAFGPTEADGAPSDKQSWSHARRWSWRSDQYRMGLMNSPQWITLATDRAPATSVPDGAKAAP
ncbi:MAG: hypothetical protein IPG06_06130 [Haliea sp.]|nr:hypothetical protein [Haliea sp.]